MFTLPEHDAHEHLHHLIADLPSPHRDLMNCLFQTTCCSALSQRLYGTALLGSLSTEEQEEHVRLLVLERAVQDVIIHLYQVDQLRGERTTWCATDDAYAFTLSLLLGYLPFAQMIPPLQALMSTVPTKTHPFTIQGIAGRYLCGDAEPRLQAALSHAGRHIVLVNNTLVVKLAHGRVAGLAIRTARTPTGIILAGRWYSPIDPSVRETLAQMFLRTRTSISLRNPSTWVLVRSLSAEFPMASYLAQVTQHLATIPAILTTDPVERQRQRKSGERTYRMVQSW